MSLLHEIQAALLDEKNDLGPILTKFRFLAARLGSDILEDWVQHEMNGYPKGVSVPDYRTAPIHYSGTFSNGFQSLTKVAIAEFLVKKHAGDEHLQIDIREPLSVIDSIVAQISDGTKDGQRWGISTGNLKLLLQDKIYDDFPMVEMYGEFSPGVFVRIQSTVRSKVLELTLELEKSVPNAADIVVGKSGDAPKIDAESVSSVAQHLINYGTVTNIQNAGSHATINIQVAQGNKDDLVKILSEGGIPQGDASEFADIVEAEEPDRENKTIGKRAQAWLGDKISKGGAAAWKAGLNVGTELLTKAALKYYGFDD